MKLYKGDCLEVMDRMIAEGVKVDAIITDPPYGTTACKWDSVIPFDEMWLRLNKLIKLNGAIVLFGSEPFSSALRMSNIKQFRYDWIWQKKGSNGNPLLAKKNPLKTHENVSVFYLDEAETKGRSDLFIKLRDYFNNEREKLGLSHSDIKTILNNWMGSHYFTNGIQWTLPTKDNYIKLQSTGGFNVAWEKLKSNYDEISKKCRIPYNPQKTKGNPYKIKQGSVGDAFGGTKKEVITINNGDRYPKSIIEFGYEKEKLHPTQKPVALMEYLIKTYTNESELVLDFTMGSGTTGVACVNTNRNFIGIELDETYFNIAKERIEKHTTQERLF